MSMPATKSFSQIALFNYFVSNSSIALPWKRVGDGAFRAGGTGFQPVVKMTDIRVEQNGFFTH
jgi:hypothetical protein